MHSMLTHHAVLQELQVQVQQRGRLLQVTQLVQRGHKLLVICLKQLSPMIQTDFVMSNHVQDVGKIDHRCGIDANLEVNLRGTNSPD